MIKKIWRKSFCFPISILIAIAAITMACVFVEENNYPASFFAPEVTHNDRYSRFNVSYHFLYNYTERSTYIDFDFKESNVYDFNNINISEWETYFQNHVKGDDLKYILYSSRLGEIDTLIFSLKKPGYPISNTLKNNSILKVPDTRAALDFLYYTGFAKRCEVYTTYETDDWFDDKATRDAKDPRNDKAAIAALADGALKQMANTKSDFVRQRYAFQVLRLYYMSRDFNKCIQFYTAQKNMLENINNSIIYRVMGYLAGAYYGLKDYSNADYLYSLIYDKYDTMKTAAFFSFHPQEEKDWNQTLALAKNAREKEVLWQMLGIYNDPLRAMQAIYALDPKSDLMDILLARAVNVQEEIFLYQDGEFPDDDNNVAMDNAGIIASDSVYKEQVDFFKMVAGKNNTAKPYEWDLAAGYLSWASGDAGFEKYLDKANNESANDSLVQDEVRLIKFLDFVKNGKAGDEKFENKLVDEFKWLREEKHARYFREDAAANFVKCNLIHKYESIHDTMKVLCLKAELNDSSKGFVVLLNKIMAFMDKPDKTPFEEFVLGELQYSKADILDMEAVKPFYDYHFKQALAILNKDDNAGRIGGFGDPFVIHINDCHDCDANDPQKVEYTTGSFLERMIALEDSVKSNPVHAAKFYFLLANGCYNMTYYGNCRAFYATKLTAVGDDFFSEGKLSDSSEIDNIKGYFDCSKAEEYYNKAADASKDIEFKAKCAFMAAKCEQNEFYTSGGGASGDFGGGKYFNLLDSCYSKTKYYHEIIKECGYFKSYLKSK
jgi:hypothetical protein